MPSQALYLSVRPPSGSKTAEAVRILSLNSGEEPLDRDTKLQIIDDETAVDPFFSYAPQNSNTDLLVASDASRLAWPVWGRDGETLLIVRTDEYSEWSTRVLQNVFGGGGGSAAAIRLTDDLMAVGVETSPGVYFYTKDGVRVNTPNLGLTTPWVYGLAFNPAGTLLAVHSNNSLILKQMSDGAGIAISGMTNPGYNRSRMAFSPDGNWLCFQEAGGGSSSRRIVELSGGTWFNRSQATFDPNSDFRPSFNADSTKVVFPGQQGVKDVAIYDLGPTITRTFVTLTEAEGTDILAAMWLPDGHLLAITASYSPSQTTYINALDPVTFAVNWDHPLNNGFPGLLDDAVLGAAPPSIGAGPGGVLDANGDPISVNVALLERQSNTVLATSYSWASGSYGFSRFMPWGPDVEYQLVFQDDSTPKKNDLVARVVT
jgi:hypothetical protein